MSTVLGLQTGSNQRLEDWSLVKRALADRQWDFRTIDGLARSTGLPRNAIENLLDAHPEEVRRSRVRDRQGRDLYTLRSRRRTWQELLAEMRAFAAKEA